ncbi:hypothetical protein [Novosphingobium sp. FKTRR1]|uniref:hypothetical protein n=1 Tax=Novosphingobium sp. FKTRR1 TaxID=2879118 RepID=UPI001CF0BA39|nr:hypothetical protein [Novosphingobium sp. FKTRR1]
MNRRRLALPALLAALVLAEPAAARDPGVILIRPQGTDFGVIAGHARLRGGRLWVFGRVERSPRLLQGRCLITVRDRAANVLGQIACAGFAAHGPAVASFSGFVSLPENAGGPVSEVQVEAEPA